MCSPSCSNFSLPSVPLLVALIVGSGASDDGSCGRPSMLRLRSSITPCNSLMRGLQAHCKDAWALILTTFVGFMMGLAGTVVSSSSESSLILSNLE